MSEASSIVEQARRNSLQQLETTLASQVERLEARWALQQAQLERLETTIVTVVLLRIAASAA